MRFKVIYNLSAGGGDRGLTSESFYTKSQAYNSALAWSEIAGADAWWWDGSNWNAL